MDIGSTTTISVIELINLSKDVAQLNLGYLGISVAILGVLGGVFIYFNIKPLKDALDKQEKTIDDLKKEADKLLDKAKERSDQVLEDFKKEQAATLSTALKEQEGRMALEIKGKLSAIENVFLEKIDTVAESKDIKVKEIVLSEANNRLRTLEKSLNTEIKNSNEDLSKQIIETGKTITSLKAVIKDLKRDIKELKVYRYSQEGKMGSVIYSIELLKEDIDEKRWSIPTSLEKLKENIKGVALDADYVIQIEEQLARIESEKKYNVLIKEIREQYTKK